MVEYNNLAETEAAGRYLVALLKAVLNQTEIPQLPCDITWENVFKTAKMHSVESMAFYGAKKFLAEDDDLFRIWKKKREQNLVQSLIQLDERAGIYRRFSQAGIRFVPLKGCILKDLYGQIDFRQMADLDILIQPEDAKAVKNLMEESGYKTVGFGEKHADEYFMYPYINVEIHKQLLPDYVSKHNYYDNIWDRVKPDPDLPGGWQMSHEDFYIYHLAHFAKHFYEMGSGIRSVVDIYVYLRAFGKEMDIRYIERELKTLELYEFGKQMRNLSLFWFSPHSKDSAHPADRDFEEIQKSIFMSGVYGSREFVKSRTMDEARIKGGILNSAGYIWKRIFMSRKEFEYAYPVTKKSPVLIPVFWFYRIIDILLHKRASVRREIELFQSKRK